MLTVRGKMTDDPIIFTLKDWLATWCFVLLACVFFCNVWSIKVTCVLIHFNETFAYSTSHCMCMFLFNAERKELPNVIWVVI
jgi:hypothetical protein